jgi:YjbE family integral membrane protein
MWIYLTGLLSVILIDLVLSGDNALVIGMACASLPPEYRKKGILYGSMVAIIMRIALAASASVLLKIPLLQTAGGLLLLWIAYKLTIDSQGSQHNIKQGTNVWEAVRTIAIADLVMSLDNVLAVGGVSKGNVSLLLIGLGLTIPIIMWGSTLVASIMTKFPWLTYAGAAILAFTAGTMITDDPATPLFNLHWIAYLGPVLILMATLIRRQFRRPTH